MGSVIKRVMARDGSGPVHSYGVAKQIIGIMNLIMHSRLDLL